jgi:hypothetical protein
MSHQRRYEQSSVFEYHSENEVINIRKQAEGMPFGIRRDELLRKASQIGVAADMNERPSSAGLQAPK